MRFRPWLLLLVAILLVVTGHSHEGIIPLAASSPNGGVIPPTL